MSGKQTIWTVSKRDVQLPRNMQIGEFIALLFYRLQMCQTVEVELFHAVDRGRDLFLALT